MCALVNLENVCYGLDISADERVCASFSLPVRFPYTPTCTYTCINTHSHPKWGRHVGVCVFLYTSVTIYSFHLSPDDTWTHSQTVESLKPPLSVSMGQVIGVCTNTSISRHTLEGVGREWGGVELLIFIWCLCSLYVCDVMMVLHSSIDIWG